MSKYRILEKKGTYAKEESGFKAVNNIGKIVTIHKGQYIPRFIVQKAGKAMVQGPFSGYEIETFEENPLILLRAPITDLKEFNDLEEARAYKRELELDDGIVIE